MADLKVSAPLATATTIAPQANPQKKRKISPGVSLAAGGIAGGVEAASTYPFEFAKTRAQLHNSSASTTSKNPFHLITTVVRTEGIGALYTGCSTLVLGTALKASVRFLSFDLIKNSLVDDAGRLSASNGILAGMAAGCVESVIAVTPTERIKTALIDDAKLAAPRMRGSFVLGSRLIVAEQGVFKGLYKGLVPTTIKQAATSAVRMGSYNILKEAAKRNEWPVNGVTTFAMGAAAGTVTVYATQPFDTLKTRAQSARGASMGVALKEVLGERGIRGLWSGSTMRLGRLVLSGGIVFSVYERVAAILSPETV